ncbi:MAG: EAL domain-containing protein [Gammaproteobacteria bacterium]|nr:EAL domain-containing protein [Gammaproteobacteria bacterium]
MENDPEARSIVETVILLGHKLNMDIVAEGVEAASCQQILHGLACNIAQGYLFARPMPGEELFAWFSQYRSSLGTKFFITQRLVL